MPPLSIYVIVLSMKFIGLSDYRASEGKTIRIPYKYLFIIVTALSYYYSTYMHTNILGGTLRIQFETYLVVFVARLSFSVSLGIQFRIENTIRGSI